MKRVSSLIKQLFAVAILLVFPLVFAPAAHAQSAAWSAINPKCVGGPENDVATIQGVECLVSNVLATVITIIGILAFVMFLVGGFKYLTAGNNSKGVEAGKNSISFAILGIVVALASFLILKTISSLTGVSTIMNFNTQYENIK